MKNPFKKSDKTVIVNGEDVLVDQRSSKHDRLVRSVQILSARATAWENKHGDTVLEFSGEGLLDVLDDNGRTVSRKMLGHVSMTLPLDDETLAPLDIVDRRHFRVAAIQLVVAQPDETVSIVDLLDGADHARVFSIKHAKYDLSTCLPLARSARNDELLELL